MAFKIVKQPRPWWPVTFAGFTEEGEVVQNSFRVRFLMLDEDEQAAVDAKYVALDVSGAAAAMVPSSLSSKIVLEIAEDWEGVQAEDGSSLPFIAENVAALMKVPNVFGAVTAAYRDCRAGRVEARLGN